MSTIASILASIVALFELVSSAVKKARIEREKAKIKENPTGWFCDHFSNGTSSADDSVHDDADSGHN